MDLLAKKWFKLSNKLPYFEYQDLYLSMPYFLPPHPCKASIPLSVPDTEGVKLWALRTPLLQPDAASLGQCLTVNPCWVCPLTVCL